MPCGFHKNIFIKVWQIKLNAKVEIIKDKKENKFKKLIWLTNLDEKQFSISKIYRKRWKIEDNIKNIKGNYGLEKFRVRKWEAIQKMISLSIFCYTLYTTISLTKDQLLKELEKTTRSFTQTSLAHIKTINLLRSLAAIINNFALIPQIRLYLAKIPGDYG